MLTLTGRSQRFAKVFGNRISLDEVETMLAERGPTVALAGEESVHIFGPWLPAEADPALLRTLARSLRLHPRGLVLHPVSDLPLTRSGKPDRQVLRRLLRGEREGTTAEPTA